MKRRFVYGVVGAALGAAIVFYAPTAGSVAPPAPPTASYSVKLIGSNGHGSGTHIGGGYILTAAHVVDGAKSMKLKTSNGRFRYARVLWTNAQYDVALLRTGEEGMATAHLSCAVLHEGDLIRADGNPLNIEFVSSSGKISGGLRDTGMPDGKGPAKAYITDMTTVMGMSGGGVFDQRGDLIGITSAVAIAPLQTGPQSAVPSLTGFGFVVPSSVVCELMGRGV